MFNFSKILFLSSTLMLLPAQTEVTLAGGGAGGGPDAANAGQPFSDRKKAKKHWTFYVVEELKSHAKTDSLSYYLTKKTRLRRLLQRIHKSERSDDKDGILIYSSLTSISFTPIDGETKKKAQMRTRNAKLIQELYNLYEDAKRGVISKEEYSKKAKLLVGFVP